MEGAVDKHNILLPSTSSHNSLGYYFLFLNKISSVISQRTWHAITYEGVSKSFEPQAFSLFR